MTQAALVADSLVKRFGGLLATDHVSISLNTGEVHALIGPNGAGKTTLVAQLSGELRSDEGAVRLLGDDVTRMPMYRRCNLGLVRSFQITNVFGEFTALENVVLAVQARSGHNFRFWRPARVDPSLRSPASSVLDRVGLADQADRPASELAYGDKRVLEIAMALATDPKVLLLDEPMAGMGPEDSQRMVRLLASLKDQFAILLVEHDMDAVFALADRISVLVYGRVIASGAPQDIRLNSEVLAAYLGEEELE